MYQFPIRVLVVALLSLIPLGANADTTGTLRPTADGGDDSTSWSAKSGTACSGTDCSADVDESSGSSCTDSDGDTSYIDSSTQNASQTFNLDLSSIADNATISAVDVSVCHIKGESGQATKFQTRYCVDGSCTNSGNNITPPATYGDRTQTFSGLSITKASSTDFEIGVIITDSSKKRVRVSQISAVITYSTSGGGGGNNNDSHKKSNETDRGPLYNPDGHDTTPVQLGQGKIKKVAEAHDVREVQVATSDAPLQVTSRPAEVAELRSLRLRTYGKVYTLTDPEGDGIYSLPSALVLPPGTHTYSLTADYGSTTRTEYGTFVVKGAVKGTSAVPRGSLEVFPRINRLFRAVFARNPTRVDWRYWANRLLKGEKRSAAELYGAMQWHHRFGKTVRTP